MYLFLNFLLPDLPKVLMKFFKGKSLAINISGNPSITQRVIKEIFCIMFVEGYKLIHTYRVSINSWRKN